MIDVTAIINVPPFSKSIFSGGVYLKIQSKNYKLRYKDPDGTTHDLGKLKFRNNRISDPLTV